MPLEYNECMCEVGENEGNNEGVSCNVLEMKKLYHSSNLAHSSDGEE
jgi:hypothetical protein